MRIKGSELTDFINNGWPSDDYYWDTDAFEETPDHQPIPDETYDTDDLSPLLWQGNEPDPTGGDGIDLASAIRKWRKTRNSRAVVVRVPNTLTDKDLRAALKPLKGTLEQ
jgi:hypothetical protein